MCTKKSKLGRLFFLSTSPCLVYVTQFMWGPHPVMCYMCEREIPEPAFQDIVQSLSSIMLVSQSKEKLDTNPFSSLRECFMFEPFLLEISEVSTCLCLLGDKTEIPTGTKYILTFDGWDSLRYQNYTETMEVPHTDTSRMGSANESNSII